MQRAIEEGTDFIETDILSSKDGVLICFHDVILDDTTDIAQHKQFANRKRTYEVQGVSVTGFFTGMQALLYMIFTPLVCGAIENFGATFMPERQTNLQIMCLCTPI